jgi:DNA-binding NarL/FixJ family response regulator
MAARTSNRVVLIVDDHDAFRSVVAEAFSQAGFTPVEAGTGQAALAEARRRRPSLVVLDVRLPDLSGYEVCRELRDELGDDLPILFVSGERAEPLDRVAGLLLGGDDYLVKPVALDELLVRARNLIDLRAPAPSNGFVLTERERQVLALLAEGLTPAQVAEELVISASTVGTHIEHVYSKLGARTRAHAVGLAYRHGLLAAR